MENKFRLAKVLKIKENEERVVKEELVAFRNNLFREQGKLNDISNEMESLKSKWLKEQTNKLNIHDLQDNFKYIRVLNEQKKRQETVVQLMLEQVETCQEKVRVKIKDRKILEKMKEKNRKEFIKEVQRLEQIFIDEMSNRKFEF